MKSDSAYNLSPIALPDEPWGAYRPSGFTQVWLRLCVRTQPRRLALWMRKPLKSRMPLWVDVTRWNLRLRLRSSGNLSEQRLLFMPRYVDREERMRLKSVLDPEDVFLDIGANFGLYSLWAASCLEPNARIEAFEPDPSLCARLTRNLEFNHLQSIHIHPYALGRESSQSFLATNTNNQGENRLSETGDGVQVATRSLAEALEQQGISRVKAAKLDVEGGEFDILEPYLSTTPRSAWPEWLFVEWLKKNTQTPPAIRLASDQGFKVVQRTRMNAVLKKQP